MSTVIKPDRTSPVRRTIVRTAGFLAVVVVAAAALHVRPGSAQEMKVVPPPAVDEPAGTGLEKAVLAGGCFWGLQGVFQHVAGVTNVVSGYSGGDLAKPSYEQVSTGTTGHAESVEITFDPKQVSYGRLLQIYFSVATDPTELNYQGPDYGTQYRGDIFAESDAQRQVATAYVAQLTAAKAFDKPIVTRVDDFKAFYPAEGYHQNYLVNHPNDFYIAINDIPKVEALQKLFAPVWKDTPVLVAGL